MSSAEWLHLDKKGSFPVDRVPADVVSLNQKFPLFDSKRTALGESSSFGVPIYVSRILLDTQELPPFPLDIAARPIRARNFIGKTQVLTRRQVVTPFHPEIGYKISTEDMDPESRREKIDKLSQEARARNYEGDFDYQQTDPLMIIVDSSEKNLKAWVST